MSTDILSWNWWDENLVGGGIYFWEVRFERLNRTQPLYFRVKKLTDLSVTPTFVRTYVHLCAHPFVSEILSFVVGRWLYMRQSWFRVCFNIDWCMSLWPILSFRCTNMEEWKIYLRRSWRIAPSHLINKIWSNSLDLQHYTWEMLLMDADVS